MGNPLIPQEIYLLERYTSVGYFDEMRTAWEGMVTLAQRCLEAFVHKLPADYRRRPLYDQPDIVWGERVLVNFQNTLEALDSRFVSLTHGDKRGLYAASRVHNDKIGFSRDYSADWMDEPQVARLIPGAADEFHRLLARANQRASNIKSTTSAHWLVGALSTRFTDARGPLDPPAQWPTYQLNIAVRVASDQVVPKSGCYMPDTDDCAPQFLVEGEPAALVQIGLNARRTQRLSEGPTVWTLVERISDTGGGIPDETPFPDLPGLALPVQFALSGETCPQTGLWSPPAEVPLPDAIVQQGEPMPVAEWHDGQGQLHQRPIRWQLVKPMD